MSYCQFFRKSPVLLCYCQFCGCRELRSPGVSVCVPPAEATEKAKVGSLIMGLLQPDLARSGWRYCNVGARGESRRVGMRKADAAECVDGADGV